MHSISAMPLKASLGQSGREPLQGGRLSELCSRVSATHFSVVFNGVASAPVKVGQFWGVPVQKMPLLPHSQQENGTSLGASNHTCLTSGVVCSFLS